MIKRYLKVWWLFTVSSFQIQLNVRWGLALFLFAKILRFATFTFFLIILLNSTKVLAGYSLDQTILFFLSFNFLDILSQLLFREVYRFRPTVLSGTFDFYLIKPINPLFRSLFTGPDLLDFVTFIPLELKFFIISASSLETHSLFGIAPSEFVLQIDCFEISLRIWQFFPIGFYGNPIRNDFYVILIAYLICAYNSDSGNVIFFAVGNFHSEKKFKLSLNGRSLKIWRAQYSILLYLDLALSFELILDD